MTQSKGEINSEVIYDSDYFVFSYSCVLNDSSCFESIFQRSSTTGILDNAVGDRYPRFRHEVYQTVQPISRGAELESVEANVRISVFRVGAASVRSVLPLTQSRRARSL